jgi:hypothetical protein
MGIVDDLEGDRARTVLASGSRHVWELRESETARGENRARSRRPPAGLLRRRLAPPQGENAAGAGAGIGAPYVAAVAPIAVAMSGGDGE